MYCYNLADEEFAAMVQSAYVGLVSSQPAVGYWRSITTSDSFSYTLTVGFDSSHSDMDEALQ
jgi:hypothetical protein